LGKPGTHAMSSLREKIITIWKEDVLLKRVIRNTSYLFSSQMVVMVLAFGQSILAARLLGASLYGWLAVIMDFATTVNRLFSFRMNEFVVRYMGRELVHKDLTRAGAFAKVAGLTETITSIFAFVIYMLLVPLGAKYIVKDVSSIPYFYIYGFFILANITYETATGILQVLNRYKIQAVFQIIQSGVTAAIIVIAFFTKGSVFIVLLGYLIGKFILGFGSIIAAWVGLNQDLGNDWIKAPFSILPPFREMAGFTISTNLSATAKLLTSGSLETQLIGFFLNTKAVAIYSIANNVTVPLMTPVSQFISTTYPEMTKSIAAKKWQELKQLLRRVTIISATWTVFFFVVMAIIGPWILPIWGQEFIAAYPVLLILMVGYSISNIFFWNRSLLLSFGKANIPLYIITGAAIAKIALAFVFVPVYGMNAEALLLSGNFVVSVGLLVWIGLAMIRRVEKKDLTENRLTS